MACDCRYWLLPQRLAAIWSCCTSGHLETIHLGLRWLLGTWCQRTLVFRLDLDVIIRHIGNRRCGHVGLGVLSAWQRRPRGARVLLLVCEDAQVFLVDILGLGRRINELFTLTAYYDVLLLRRCARYGQRWGRAGARRGGSTSLAIPSTFLLLLLLFLFLLDVELLWLGKAVLEEGRGAGPFNASQASLAGVAGIGREAGGAVRVIDAQVVLIPVAAVLAQPGRLQRS